MAMTEDETRIDELSRILRRKHQFVIDTLHAIRTPLQGILGLAGQSLTGGDDAKKTRNLELILRSSEELRRLVSDLLEIERIEIGEIVYEFVHFDVPAVVDDVLDLGEALLGDKEIRLERDLPPDLPPVHGDVRKIRQVLLNFLSNAIQFTEKGWVRISARAVDDHVRIDVQDTGVGIAEDEREIVWEQFRQTGGAISPDYEGSGLGLSMNKKIVEGHRGEIGLTSELGKGSTFFFTIPTCESGLLPAMKRAGPGGEKEREVRYRSPRRGKERISIQDVYDEAVGIAAPERAAPVKREPLSREVVTGHGERILVVDASPVSMELLKDLLSGNGYEVLEAPDGPAALRRLESDPPHLILTELWLPEMTGFDLVKSVRESEENGRIPIILLTARRNQEDIAYGLNLGADDYLQKPFDRNELLARIGVRLRLSGTQEELRQLNLGLEEEVKKRTLELGAAYERLYLSEKLSSLGLLTAGIAHELNNPLAYVLSNVEIVRERLAAREALRNVRRARARIETGGAEAGLLDALGRSDVFRRDVEDFREEAARLGVEARARRFLEFVDYIEKEAARLGGGETGLFPASIRLLNSAEDGLKRAKRIVYDLSAFSRPGDEDPGAMDLNQSVERALTLLSSSIREREVRVTAELDLGEPIRGVSGRIEQVILNLIQNAVQASPRGEESVVRTGREEDRGVVEIEDRGEGIRPEDRARIFDPFFTTKPVGEGTGLGLSICYRIVEGLGGHISFRSRPGEGTKFTVWMPIATAGGEEDA
jgi:two-component system sensor histidine kinase ChiS